MKYIDTVWNRIKRSVESRYVSSRYQRPVAKILLSWRGSGIKRLLLTDAAWLGGTTSLQVTNHECGTRETSTGGLLTCSASTTTRLLTKICGKAAGNKYRNVAPCSHCCKKDCFAAGYSSSTSTTGTRNNEPTLTQYFLHFCIWYFFQTHIVMLEIFFSLLFKLLLLIPLMVLGSLKRTTKMLSLHFYTYEKRQIL